MDISALNPYEITYILPESEFNLNDEDEDDIPVDLDNINCSSYVKTINIHSTEPNPNYIEVVVDNELSLDNDGKSVIEVMGSSTKLTFHETSHRQYLVFHFKPINRFFKLSFILHDRHGIKRNIELANNRSIIAVDSTVAQLPLVTSSTNTWQRVCLDLPNIMQNAFGIQSEDYSHCSEVVISGSCRIAKLFFQSYDYADPELPKCLRVVCTTKKSS